MAKKTNWVATLLIAVGALFILFPLYMTVSIALKTPEELADSVLSLPVGLHVENFAKAIEATNFFQAFKNSAFITVTTVVLTIITNSMVAYAIARNMHRKFFRFLYYYFVSALFIPFPIIMLPIVKQTSAFGMNNPSGLVFLYVVYGIAFNIFIYVGYIRSIPKELEEAAIMDGCSTWGVFWRVVFPLMAPINATVAILTCLWAWNDFLLPLIVLSDQSDMTLPLVQYVFQSKFGTDYNLAFASYLMALSPMIIVYLFAQKWIIGGVTRGAIK
ncbi:carbohydrate ABC transporter permease [Geobacillus stearothermophilus]|uniref:carbohydrate ABC transporter permease n=1 Tax=Geobacillus stearothermophilus TaxID=1422 RepID=UPI0006AC0B6A|nr:carbohydrate ABC transporter permease [Geobacillus stearothermophilus]KOR94327.1 ABC transporter permease [Geobacillus stearothermophilus ATCC 12980]MED3724525.1 carbohydrate ABC transporter permease [Geobacillus stearothermophilus]MED3748381.1 carbohydrate ABC transporter permease [Geobacillus stearothermophilus]MED3754032.1 carbohydrate ABC transporter permease [Geobacillus stearothermophilus]MED3770596.1 carbohydrate ABC transporter permease [Geobacillus stearothermophilus]